MQEHSEHLWELYTQQACVSVFPFTALCSRELGTPDTQWPNYFLYCLQQSCTKTGPFDLLTFVATTVIVNYVLAEKLIPCFNLTLY